MGGDFWFTQWRKGRKEIQNRLFALRSLRLCETILALGWSPNTGSYPTQEFEEADKQGQVGGEEVCDETGRGRKFKRRKN